jgi:hypothetical protein
MSYLSRASLLETLNLYNAKDYLINISFIFSKISILNVKKHPRSQNFSTIKICSLDGLAPKESISGIESNPIDS